MNGTILPYALLHPAPPTTYRIDGRDRLIDDVHAICDSWERERCWEALLGSEGRTRLRLALHEWAANLVQHAHFDGPAVVELMAWVHGAQLRVVVEDNTAGFDFEAQRRGAIEDIAVAMPDRGMGLAIIRGCAEHVTYERLGSARNRLVLSLKGQRRAVATPVPAGTELLEAA